MIRTENINENENISRRKINKTETKNRYKGYKKSRQKEWTRL